MGKSESEKALEYLNAREADSTKHIIKGPCITVSRESGAGSGLVDEILVSYLSKYQIEETSKWAIFDRNLIEKVLEDHNLPKRLAGLMSTENQHLITSTLSELLGLQPSRRTLFHNLYETILQIAETGNVIIVGRGANIITSKLRYCFHVRLVAPFENRVARIQEYYRLDKKDAIDWVKREDQDRKEYFQKNFHRDIDDPLLYHMTLNTGMLTYEETAHIIGRMVMEKFPETFHINRSAAASLQATGEIGTM